jgi:hypothetical protein
MNVFARTLQYFKDVADKSTLETELAKLRADLAIEQVASTLARRQLTATSGELRAERDLTTSLRARLNVANQRAIDLNNDLDLALSQGKVLAKAIEEKDAQLLEANTALEEANTAIATLKNVRSEEQLAIFEPAGPVPEAGGEAPEIDEIVHDTHGVFVFQVRGVFFDDGKHFWLLSNSKDVHKVPMRDKEFLDRVSTRKEFFAAGDALRAWMHVITYRRPDNGSVYVKYSVERDTQIIPPDRQIAIKTLEEVPPLPPTSETDNTEPAAAPAAAGAQS